MHNYVTQQILGYHLSLYQQFIEKRNPPVINDFFKKFLTHFELSKIIHWKMNDLGLTPLDVSSFSEKELWDIIEDDHTILCYYINEWEQYLKNQIHITDTNVWQTLQELQRESHYLATKTVVSWDAYDHSNYRNLLLKAGRIIRIYGIYDKSISQKNITEVTSPPLRYFDSYQDAEKALEELLTYGKHHKETLHILYLYKPI